jgi:hypothetical protein
MADKSGGDVTQANFGSQGNLSGQAAKGVANTGGAFVDSVGGESFLEQAAAQAVAQELDQNNIGFGGFGGSDNIEANTIISIS